jgi:transposase-like protein
MKCPKCNSNNFDVICKESKKRKISLISNVLMTIITLGLWIVIPIISSQKNKIIENKIVYVCKDCGKEFTKKEAII